MSVESPVDGRDQVWRAPKKSAQGGRRCPRIKLILKFGRRSAPVVTLLYGRHRLFSELARDTHTTVSWRVAHSTHTPVRIFRNPHQKGRIHTQAGPAGRPITHKVQPDLPAISHERQVISTTGDVTSQNSSDVSLGRRPLSKSEEFLGGFDLSRFVV